LLNERIARHLHVLYPGRVDAVLVEAVQRAIGLDGTDGTDGTDLVAPRGRPVEPPGRWDERTTVLISYADTVHESQRPPLHTLHDVLANEGMGAASVVHVLPFYPWSSDDGFAVIDHHEVDARLGSWSDVAGLADESTVMADVVINHRSAASREFDQFVRGELPGRDWFVTADPSADLSSVVRPRTHDLLRAVDTPAGRRHVWCTFGPDQPDLDFTNPDVLLDTLKVIDQLLVAGVRWLRLDAVAYVWKEIGSPCVHLAQTHEIVKLIVTLLSAREPAAVVLTETNVPHEENVSYLGDGDEAHLIYNFSLPPLLLHAVLTGDTGPLTEWVGSTGGLPAGTTTLNFLASHDGIGLRPAEGILTESQVAGLVERAHLAGGLHSEYARPDGPRPYELNVSLYDLVGGAAQCLAAHAIMLSLSGVPAFYVHSLFGTPNDHDGVARRGHNRAINRRKFARDELGRLLAADGGERAAMLTELVRLRRIRAAHPAFHPASPQAGLALGVGLFGVTRGVDGRGVTCVTNLRPDPAVIDLSHHHIAEPTDLVSGQRFESTGVALEPLQSVWLSDSTAS